MSDRAGVSARSTYTHTIEQRDAPFINFATFDADGAAMGDGARAKLPPGPYSGTFQSECHRTLHLTAVAGRRP
jgi:hypothetical protein